MKELMNAIRIKDGAAVTVRKLSKIKWTDTVTDEIYFLHIDIELLY